MTRAEQKVSTRLHILQTATKLFEAHGWEATTIRGIAKAAGMSTGAVFASFESKETLHAEVYGRNAVAWRVAETAVTASGKDWASMPMTERTLVGSLAVIMLRDAGTLAQ